MRRAFLISFILVFFCLLLSGCFAVELNSSYSGPAIAAGDYAVKIDEQMSTLFKENKDNYAAYFNTEEFQEMTESYYGEYGGIGIFMISNEGDPYPYVLSTMHDSPAESGGILSGDRILKIDGEDIAQMDLDIVASKVKGNPGTAVTLEISRGATAEEQTVLEFELTREMIKTDSLTGSYLIDQPGIAYISIFSFTENTAQEFSDMMAALTNKQAMKGLIIDLRNNGGGSLGASLELASYFVPSGNVVIWQKMVDGMHSDLSQDGRWNRLPLVILQNGGTASASEVFTGALRDYKIATTVGEKSYGKGITQTIYTLNSGAAVRFTESRYYTPNKYDLHGKGLDPDITEKAEKDFFADPYAPDLLTDNQLAKALEVIKEKITANGQ